jgi:hypothetical protein
MAEHPATARACTGGTKQLPMVSKTYRVSETLGRRRRTVLW